MLAAASWALLTLAPRVARAEANKASATANSKAAASAESADASDDDGQAPEKNAHQTLADRIRPVSGAVFTRKGRSELEPLINVSLNDAFFQKYMFGLKYAYHATESVAIELSGAFALNTTAGAINKCSDSTCAAPTADDLKGTPGKLGLVAGLDVLWAPLYGKLNLAGETVLHFDTFGLIGLDGVQYQQPALGPDDDASSAFTFGGHFGVGQHFVFNAWSALRVQLCDYIYSGQRAVNGEAKSHIENQLMLELGVSFFFPLHPSHS